MFILQLVVVNILLNLTDILFIKRLFVEIGIDGLLGFITCVRHRMLSEVVWRASLGNALLVLINHRFLFILKRRKDHWVMVPVVLVDLGIRGHGILFLIGFDVALADHHKLVLIWEPT